MWDREYDILEKFPDGTVCVWGICLKSGKCKGQVGSAGQTNSERILRYSHSDDLGAVCELQRRYGDRTDVLLTPVEPITLRHCPTSLGPDFCHCHNRSARLELNFVSNPYFADH